MAEPNETPPTRDRTPRRSRKKKVAVDGRRQVEFLYRGQSVTELQALSHEQVLALLTSGARRYLKRMGANEQAQKFLAKIEGAEEGATVRTHLREFPVLPSFVGKNLEVHNGKEYKSITVVPEMIGHKLGEFALTRGSVKHTGPGVGATRSSKFMPLK